ncbi:hypothetical protein NE237_018288 [Protea cynaroides]|uniref:Iron hydrogenase large subunit C-terminal domain-containing protein n=1 Tax=Protea cynaroides TaxID=273540 RepID=A0A9Q0K9N2_9MAGN|nr:hypothetical protein NE237_018288 [Protea cynaroides]
MIGNDGNGSVEKEALWNFVLDLRKKLEKLWPVSDLLSKEVEGFFRAGDLGIISCSWNGAYFLKYSAAFEVVTSSFEIPSACIRFFESAKLELPNNVYHVTVMPCYDKKLEAARDDFLFSMEPQGDTVPEDAGLRITEVDSVLTTGEVLDI